MVPTQASAHHQENLKQAVKASLEIYFASSIINTAMPKGIARNRDLN